MRIMNLKYSNKKKVRGAKRKCKSMIDKLAILTQAFPQVNLDYGYWHLHLPVAQTFIDSSKTPSYVRKLCIQTLINRVKFLINIKPKLNVSSHVIGSIVLPNLWNSQITVFFGDDYFQNFFERNNEYQKWTLLPQNRSLKRELNLDIPDGLMLKGYLEEICDEDYTAISEIWFVGEMI